jgi:hypothetical protein
VDWRDAADGHFFGRIPGFFFGGICGRSARMVETRVARKVICMIFDCESCCWSGLLAGHESCACDSSF